MIARETIKDVLRGSIAATTLIGGTASVFNNPFVAQADFVKGMLAHCLVGAATNIGAVVFGVGGALSVGGAGFVVGSILDGSTRRRARSFAAAGSLIGLIVGGGWGGVQGYHVSSQMLSHGVQSYKAAAAETSFRSALPVCPVRKGNQVVAAVSRAVPRG